MGFAVRLVLCLVAWLMPVSAAAYWDSIADERAWHLAVRAYALDPARDAEFDLAYQDMATALRIRCLGDDMAACHGLAGYYRQGRIVPGDEKLAISLNWLGCEVEYGPSCLPTTMQEVLYEVSWPGLPYFVKGCKQGQANACSSLWMHYMHRDPDLAAHMKRATCDADPLHMICTNLLSDEETAAVTRAAEESCAAGDAEGCLRAATLAWRAQDFGLALSLHQTACDLDEAEGCARAARMLREGKGADVDIAAADALTARERALRTTACETDATTCHALGHVLSAAGDTEGAIAAHQKACIADHPAQDVNAPCEAVERLKPQPQITLDLMTDAGLDAMPEGLQPASRERRDACAAGDQAACLAFAKIASSLRQSPEIVEAADALFALACEDSVAVECLGRGLDADARAQAFNAACAAGNTSICVTAIMFYQKDRGAAARRADIAALCEDGIGVACGKLGRAYATETYALPVEAIDIAHAISLFKKGCALDDAASCGQLAWHAWRALDYPEEEHPGAEISRAEMLALHERACRLGDSGGCSMRGFFEEDPISQQEWGLRACLAGDCHDFEGNSIIARRAEANARFGAFEAVLSDARAFDFIPEWQGTAARLRRMCRAGSMHACFELGDDYDANDGGHHQTMEISDTSASALLYTHACDNGLGIACLSRGSDLEYSSDDPKTALALYRRGCELGSKLSCDAADALADRIGD